MKKTLFALITVLLLASFSLTGAKKVKPSKFLCTVTNVTFVNASPVYTVTCPVINQVTQCRFRKNNPNCVKTVLDIPEESWPKAWGESMAEGMQVKGQWVNGKFRPVEGCREKFKKILDEYCGIGLYCKPPASLGLTEECIKDQDREKF